MPKAKASGRKVYMRIEQDSGTADSQGGHTPNWTTVSGLEHVPMEFGGSGTAGQGMSAHQKYHLMQLYPKANVTLKMRYRSVAVKSGMRAVWGSHIYQIRGAENVGERNETVMLYCEELQAVGSKR
jgi:hypothetical protein